MLAAGQKLVEAGTLTEAGDVFFLHLWELKALGSGESRDWKALIAERRATYARELRRRRIPRIMLSDGTAFYDAPSTGDAANTLSGSPVSAGVVEGTVRVVLDPHGVQLVPGEILVCPATDPAWTPLFLAAGGLVMEVGGMMTHGSVVAREYGIPAVVGVSQATTRLQTGQRVRVDGSSGLVTVLEDHIRFSGERGRIEVADRDYFDKIGIGMVAVRATLHQRPGAAEMDVTVEPVIDGSSVRQTRWYIHVSAPICLAISYHRAPGDTEPGDIALLLVGILKAHLGKLLPKQPDEVGQRIIVSLWLLAPNPVRSWQL